VGTAAQPKNKTILVSPQKAVRSVGKPVDADSASLPSLFQSAVKKNPKSLKVYRTTPSTPPIAFSAATSVVKPSSDPCCSSSRLIPKAAERHSDEDSVDSAPTIELRPEEFIINPEDNLVNTYFKACRNVGSDDDHDDDSDNYHQNMKAKLASYLKDANLASDDDDEGAEADDELEAKRERRSANVPEELADNQLDHVILACSNLLDGMKQFEQLTGLKPTKIGFLRGVGTKSARVNLTNKTFIEIIGPDDKASSEGIGSELLDLPDGKLIPYHYAVRNQPNNVKIPSYLAWERDSIIMTHADPEDFDDDGETHLWDLLLLYGHGLGGVIPAFVNWREKKFHPTARLEQEGAKLNYVQVRAPEGSYAHDLLDGVEGITMAEGEPTLTISIDTPKGEVTFSSPRPEGIQMPGFGDDNHPSLHMPTPGKPELLPVREAL
jgi:hypothetical protein